jgi:hypothetical protein
MSLAHTDVAAAVRKARDRAKGILTDLEGQGHSQSNQSSSLYLALVGIQKRLLAVDPPPPPVSRFVPELEQLVHECAGKLAPVKSLLEEALHIARSSPEQDIRR